MLEINFCFYYYQMGTHVIIQLNGKLFPTLFNFIKGTLKSKLPKGSNLIFLKYVKILVKCLRLTALEKSHKHITPFVGTQYKAKYEAEDRG